MCLWRKTLRSSSAAVRATTAMSDLLTFQTSLMAATEVHVQKMCSVFLVGLDFVLSFSNTAADNVLFLDSKNPSSSPSALSAQRAGVLPAASVCPVPGPGSGLVDVPPPQTSVWSCGSQ